MIKFLLTIVLIVALNPGRCVWAEDTIQVVTENWSPYNYIEGGVVKGSSTEIVRKVLERAGLSYDIRVYPWARAYMLARRSKNTLIYTIVRMPEREKQFKWIGEVAEADKTYLYKLKSRKDINIHNLSDVRFYRIGVIRESMYHHFLARRGGHKNLQFISRISLNYDKLTKNRIDLWAEGERNFNAEMTRRAALGPIAEIEKAFYLFTYPYYMAFSLDTSDEIVKKVRQAYDELVREGAI